MRASGLAGLAEVLPCHVSGAPSYPSVLLPALSTPLICLPACASRGDRLNCPPPIPIAGVMKQEGEKDTGTFFLFPCDPRLPRMMVRSATLPPQIKQVSGRGVQCCF